MTTLHGSTVLLFGGQKSIFPHPVIQLGIDPTDGQAHPVTVGPTGQLAAADAGPAWTSARGLAGAPFTSANQSGSVASVTDAPTSGQKIVITDLLISSDTALRLDFSVESSATVIESLYIGANASLQFTPRGKWKLSTADKKLQVKASASGNIRVTPFYYSEA